MKAERELSSLLSQYDDEIVEGWVVAQAEDMRREVVSAEELESQARLMLSEVHAALEDSARLRSKESALHSMLTRVSQRRARQGFTPTENARFLLNLKEGMIPVLRREFADDPERLVELVDRLGHLVDELVLHTFEIFLAQREILIREQESAIMELSTPALELWDGILVLPLVGALDTLRAQQMTELLLETIVQRRSSLVIVDVTGVMVVDTAVARHLVQTIRAVRLLGARTIVVGISAQMAQTMVQLGVELGDVTTSASLGSGLKVALEALGWTLQRAE